MNWYIVKLNFISPLHIGSDEAGIGVENVQPVIHSDTLFSALVNSAALIETNLVNFLLAGEFCISSAFPYDTRHYYLPRPLFPLPKTFGKYAEDVKDCEFLQEGDFLRWISGELNETNIMPAVSSTGKMEIFETDIRPRNASDRETANTLFYHCGGVVFKKGCGLYFLLETEDNHLGNFRTILKNLEKLGLGGERSSGYGQFEFEIIGSVVREGLWQNIRNIQGNHFCILSLCYPNENECRNVQFYQTVLRKGWVFSYSSAKQMKRNTCRMFKEGSIFNTRPEGKIVPVTPFEYDHEVYRWGKALSVGMNIRSVIC